MAVRCKCNRFLPKEKPCACGLQIVSKTEDAYYDANGYIYAVVDNKLQPKTEEKKMSGGFLNVNHSEAGGFGVIDPGKYEAVISDVKIDKAKSSGAPMIKVTLTIRDDVDQPARKRKLFDNLVQSEKAMFKFQQVAKAVQMPNGASVATMEDFARQILGQAVRVTVDIEDYQGKDQNRIKFYDVPEVAYGGGAIGGGARDPFADSGTPLDISDDDLPF